MQFLHYVVGKGRSGKVVAYGLDLCADPEASLVSMKGVMPFEVSTLATEVGDSAKLEELRKKFQLHHVQGPWFKPVDEIRMYIESVDSVDPDLAKSKRVSLDLTPEDFSDLETLVKETGVKGKAKLLRKALRFYSAMYRYKAQGYMIQAVQGGKMIQFPDLEAIR